ncbi:MAG: hypothetical protein D6729_12605, partial [Deltaproteobacteria bacterium]
MARRLRTQVLALGLFGAALALTWPGRARARALAPVAGHGPRALDLRLHLRPSHLVLHQTERAVVELRLPEGMPRPERVRIAVNSGTASTPEIREEGVVHFTYHLPNVGYPHHALFLLSLEGSGEETIAVFRAPLTGTARLGVDTTPGARVYGEIAGRRYGPFLADTQGKVELRLPARPGESVATIIARDPSGASRRRQMPLPVPPQNRIVFLAHPPAPELPAGGLWVFVRGGKAVRARLRVEARPGGRLTPPISASGLSLLALPPDKLAGWDQVRLSLRIRGDPTSRVEITLPVPAAVQGPRIVFLAPRGSIPDA